MNSIILNQLQNVEIGTTPTIVYKIFVLNITLHSQWSASNKLINSSVPPVAITILCVDSSRKL